MAEIERLFDTLLDDAASGKRTPAECLDLCQKDFPELVSLLQLAFALRAMTPDGVEVADARANVRRNLDAYLDDECGAGDHQSATPDIPSPRQSKRRARWVPLTVCAALLLISVIGSLALSAASANALPGSPLYAIKRADENFLLICAWSNQMRGAVLAQIAQHRLAEARAEASQRNPGLARALMAESNSATQQLIMLVITMHQNNDDDPGVIAALHRTLQAEYDALSQARSNGQTWMVQMLSASVADQQNMLSANHITIPAGTTPVPALPSAPARSTPQPHPTPVPHATPAVKPTPGSGGGHGGGNGQGGNGGNGGNSDNGSNKHLGSANGK